MDLAPAFTVVSPNILARPVAIGHATTTPQNATTNASNGTGRGGNGRALEDGRRTLLAAGKVWNQFVASTELRIPHAMLCNFGRSNFSIVAYVRFSGHPQIQQPRVCVLIWGWHYKNHMAGAPAIARQLVLFRSSPQWRLITSHGDVTSLWVLWECVMRSLDGSR